VAAKLSPGVPVKLHRHVSKAPPEITGKLTSIGGNIDATTHLVKRSSTFRGRRGYLALGNDVGRAYRSSASPRHFGSANSAAEDAKGAFVFTVSEGEAKTAKTSRFWSRPMTWRSSRGSTPEWCSQSLSRQFRALTTTRGRGGEAMNLALWAARHRRSILFLLLVAAIAGAFSAFGCRLRSFRKSIFPA